MRASATVCSPRLSAIRQFPEKLEILHLMEALGINSLDLGRPGAGARAVEAVTALAREIVAHKMMGGDPND